LIKWAIEKDYVGKNYRELPVKAQNRFHNVAKRNNEEIEKLLIKLGIKTDVLYEYESIEEIRDDFYKKGLVGKTPNEVIHYDNCATLANVRRFAKRKNFSLSSIWNIVGVIYSPKVEMRDGKIKAKYAYTSLSEIANDIVTKGLVGKSPRDIQVYDGSKTYGNIIKFAKRNEIAMKTIWSTIGIIPTTRSSNRNIDPLIFSSVDSIKSHLKSIGLSECHLRDIRADKRLYQTILDFAKERKMDRGVIWNEIGVESSLLILNSIEDVILLLKKYDLRDCSVSEIRSNEFVYDAICNYAKKNQFSLTGIWKLLGIKNSYQK